MNKKAVIESLVENLPYIIAFGLLLLAISAIVYFFDLI